MALSDNCFSYYKYDGDANDSTTNNNDGTVSGATLTTGKINQGYLFDGSNDKISSNGFTSETFSFSCFINTSVVGGSGFPSAYRYIITLSDSSNYSVNLLNRGDKIRFGLWRSAGADTDFLDSNTIIAINTWYHIVCTFNFTNKLAKLYINGVLDNSKTFDTTNWNQPNNQTLYVGSRADIYGIFNGIIDEVGIWNRELSSEEAIQLYNSGDGLQYPFDVGWSNLINGVTAVKVNGIDASNIVKIDGL